MVVTPVNDLSNKIQRINVEVTMNSAFYEGNNYEASIAPGAQYELFANTGVNISTFILQVLHQYIDQDMQDI